MPTESSDAPSARVRRRRDANVVLVMFAPFVHTRALLMHGCANGAGSISKDAWEGTGLLIVDSWIPAYAGMTVGVWK